MTKDELFYNMGTQFTNESGHRLGGGIVSDALSRAKIKEELMRQINLEENKHRIVPKVVDEYCYGAFMSPEAFKKGFGLEDLIAFVKWLEKLTGWDIIE